MFAKLRNYVKKLLPASYWSFRRGVKDIVTEVHNGRDEATKELARLHSEDRISLERLESISRECNALVTEVASSQLTDRRALRDLAMAVDKIVQQQEAMTQTLGRVEGSLEALAQSAETQGRAINETLWAEIFKDTTSSSDWLHDKTFSPGRWAVGYPYLYVLYRILNEVRPQRVLELGLGQSTRMMAQFAAGDDGVQHLVVEHDDDWIKFFSSNYRLPDSTHIVKLDWDYVAHKEAEKVRVYSGFAQAVEGMQFDLISIDGPLGGDMEQYARIDVLGLLPGCLAPSFVILLDDLERNAEARTMHEMQSALSEAGVDHLACHYSGSKDLGLLCSTDLAFLCSL